MNTNLTMFDNLQFEPIQIKPYSIVEVYQSNLDSKSCLGYFIQPVVDNMQETIETRVREVADKSGEFDSLVILAGRGGQYFNYRRVYAVWYNKADGAPSYPGKPNIDELPKPAQTPSPYTDFTFDNDGVDCYGSIELTIGNSTDRVVELWLNDNHMTITLPENLTEDNNVVIVNLNGVLLNQQKINTFDIQTIPKIKSGSNCLRIKNTNVTKAKVTYENKY